MCEQKFNIEHTLPCLKGEFIAIRHNQVRDTTTNLLKMIYRDVKIEVPLLPFSGESLSERADNTPDSARQNR